MQTPLVSIQIIEINQGIVQFDKMFYNYNLLIGLWLFCDLTDISTSSYSIFIQKHVRKLTRNVREMELN